MDLPIIPQLKDALSNKSGQENGDTQKPRFSKAQRREWLAALLFIAPSMLGFLVFSLIPVVSGFGISFTKWSMLNPPVWVGLDNYRQLLFNDSLFWHSLKNTLYYSILVIPVGIVISLGLALILNTKLKGISIFRTIYFLPMVASSIAVATMWKWIFEPQFGVLNTIFKLVGLKPLDWLLDPNLAMPCIALVAIWQAAGFRIIIFLAGLKSIPQHLYEAAEIDGASWVQRFRYITLPLLTPTTFFVLVMSVIGSFQVFGQVYILTQGGPKDATQVYLYYLWLNAFTYFKMGYASAMAYILFLLILAITLLQFKYMNKWVNYDLI